MSTIQQLILEWEIINGLTHKLNALKKIGLSRERLDYQKISTHVVLVGHSLQLQQLRLCMPYKYTLDITTK